MPSAQDDPNSSQGDDAHTAIVKLAEEKARQHGHAAITFNHLLYAAIKKYPEEIDGIMNPIGLRTPSLMGLLEKDIKSRPATLKDGEEIKLSRLSGQALKRADVASDQRWGGGQLFAAELLNSMVEIGKVEKEERSTTLDYIRITLSQHADKDAGEECRKHIDKLATARGIKPLQGNNNPPANKSGSKNGDKSMPANNSAYIVPIKDGTMLKQFATNMNERADKGELDPIIGRDEEVTRVIEVLARSKKNNPLLIGEAGVGKTAIVEGLAQRMNSGNVPDFLKNKNILQLDLSLMIAGTKYRGEFEERLKNLMKEIKEMKNVIVFLDEIHTMIGAGGAEGAMDAANILKPALARGEFTCIGSTTLSEYKKSLEKDKAIKRRFEAIKVSEPDAPKAKLMVGVHQKKLEAFHGVKFSPAAIDACVEMANRYFSNDTNSQPDKSVTLADDAAVLVKLDNAREDKTVNVADIATIVSRRTGIPAGNVTQNDLATLRQLPEKLKSKVFHQDDAIDAVAGAIQRNRTGFGDPNKPVGSFLFLGPTGSGKTEVARQLAYYLFGSAKKMHRFDMSEFMEKHAVAKLIGAPPGYVGYEEGGQLTEKVRHDPYSVILLDEIEKAHPDTFNIFLQVLEDGRLTDGLGQTVDFKNTVIIMTSNAAALTGAAPGLRIVSPGQANKPKTDNGGLSAEKMAALAEKEFKPEFLNRLDKIIEFKSLPKEAMPKVVTRIIDEMKKDREGMKDLTLDLANDVVPWLVDKGWNPLFNARPYKRLVDVQLAEEFSNAVLFERLHQGVPTTVKVTVKPDKSGLAFEYNEASTAAASYDAAGDDLIRKPVNDSNSGGAAPAAPAAN